MQAIPRFRPHLVLVFTIGAGVATIVASGCTTPAGAPDPPGDVSPETVDGLRAAQIDMPGSLFIREDHGIGSYDAFLIPAATIQYERRSVRLPEEMEQEFLTTLEQSLIDLSEDADIPIVREPDRCVMQIGLALVDVDLDRPGGELKPDKMTLVMEFRDSLSGQPLLRYATANTMDRGGPGSARSDRIRLGFDEMLDGMEISGALNAAGLGGQPIREGCNGTLAARGSGAARAGVAEP